MRHYLKAFVPLSQKPWSPIHKVKFSIDIATCRHVGTRCVAIHRPLPAPVLHSPPGDSE